jgi:predicted outer membrane protein
LSDGQIAEVTSVANTGEISSGTLAVNRAVSPAVIDYAQSRIALYQLAEERQTAVVIAIGVTPSPSALSAQLTEDTVRIRTQLESASAAEFDVLYLRSQVELQQRLLTAIDDQLLPNVVADTLRSELVLTRTQVQGYLDTARALLATLEGSDEGDAGVP